MRDLQHRRDPLHRGFALRPGHFAHLQRESNVPGHAHVRIERITLEHHRDVAVAAGQESDIAIGHMDAARAWRFQPGDHVQQRALAATRGADQDQELTGLDLDVYAFEHFDGTEGFADLAD